MTDSSVRMARRQKAGRANRAIGYVSLPMLVLLTVAYYVRRDDGDIAHVISNWTQILFLPFFFLHVLLTMYVFGFVRPRRTLRVFHIYFGYATLVVVMVSQTTFGNEPLHTTTTVLMYVAILVHITIGLRYGVTRHSTEMPRTGFAVDRRGAADRRR
jgi:succinate dehydrogenase hydrophobic anchor subunit